MTKSQHAARNNKQAALRGRMLANQRPTVPAGPQRYLFMHHRTGRVVQEHLSWADAERAKLAIARDLGRPVYEVTMKLDNQ